MQFDAHSCRSMQAASAGCVAAARPDLLLKRLSKRKTKSGVTSTARAAIAHELSAANEAAHSWSTLAGRIAGPPITPETERGSLNAPVTMSASQTPKSSGRKKAQLPFRSSGAYVMMAKLERCVARENDNPIASRSTVAVIALTPTSHHSCVPLLERSSIIASKPSSPMQTRTKSLPSFKPMVLATCLHRTYCGSGVASCRRLHARARVRSGAVNELPFLLEHRCTIVTGIQSAIPR